MTPDPSLEATRTGDALERRASSPVRADIGAAIVCLMRRQRIMLIFIHGGDMDVDGRRRHGTRRWSAGFDAARGFALTVGLGCPRDASNECSVRASYSSAGANFALSAVLSWMLIATKGSVVVCMVGQAMPTRDIREVIPVRQGLVGDDRP